MTTPTCPLAGVPMTALLRWKKHRMVCVNEACATQSFTLSDHRIAATGCMLTTRAAKWVTKEIGSGQTVTHLAKELGCSWDSVNAAMRIYGAALLTADTKRLEGDDGYWSGRDALRATRSPQGEVVVDDGL